MIHVCTPEDYAIIAAHVRADAEHERRTEAARPVAQLIAAARGARYPDWRDWQAARNATDPKQR